LDQGLTEEAREIIETLLIAYPGHARASELNERLIALEAGGQGAPAEEAPAEEAPPPSVSPVGADEPAAGGGDAFDLAAELADELGELGGEEAAPAPASDDYQVSVEEVFSEFKKGLEKVVKPEDVETHYDLGIAYKEMGLLDDAIGEFVVARQGCLGKKKEIDCLTMTGLLQVMKGDNGAAVDAFRLALTSEHVNADSEKALRYELGCAHEANGSLGRALFQFNKVSSLDAKYRDVVNLVGRLSSSTEPEDDPLPAKAKAAKPAASANGSNGVKGKADGSGPAGGAAPASAAKPAEPAGPKNRKVGFV
jgi:tetratricopeptide (TPR) repeat protein